MIDFFRELIDEAIDDFACGKWLSGMGWVLIFTVLIAMILIVAFSIMFCFVALLLVPVLQIFVGVFILIWLGLCGYSIYKSRKDSYV